ncbi:DUF6319 family protein [Antrihabitans stalactiti]|jgi:hypothetical protein|uniref:Translation initiation factor n=1 Tax=Antrihabitans stalactiti TaxID=2584121 RepID=A0A848K8V6_9NOCA|nr:DUF6319 family protein [Antrihabitans stalactiti]NMN95375.1 hypothetical protein [Antrihabitans stalactiti]
MPPRRRSTEEPPLTADDLAALDEAVNAGRRATVYLREAMPSLNLPAGASGRVVKVTGSTVLVRPRGVDDELPFEADEIRLTRKQAPEPATSPTKPPETEVAEWTPAPPPAAPKPRARRSEPTPADAPAKPASPAKPAAIKKLADGVTVTIQGTLDNTWTVGVAYGSRPAGKPRSVGADAVERALVALDDDVAREAVGAVLSAARQAVAARISELSKQLDEAKNQLAALGSSE